MSNSNIKDDKNAGNVDKNQRDKDHKSNVDHQSGQRQQSTGQPGGQQGGRTDDRTQQSGHQQSAGHQKEADENRKPGKS